MPELIWDGKYDASGRRVPPMRVSLPFQTVETVNESSQERQRTLDLFASGRDTDWRNRLVWGDRKYVLPALLSEFVGAVDLVYIDPPFATGANFSFQVQVDGSDFTKEPTLIEQKAYRDTWGRGLDGYLAWLSESLSYLYQLLAPNGSLYLHLDWRVVHYAKAILDEIFGTQGFRNEIIWKRTTAHSDAHTAGAIHDTLLFYSKSDKWTWNEQFTPYEQSYLDQYYRYKEPNGRRFMSADLSAAGLSGGRSDYIWNGVRRLWRIPEVTMRRLDKEGRIFYTKNGMPRLKRYLDEAKGQPLSDVWQDIFPVVSWSKERVGYDTQKPEELLRRILSASSNSNDLVLDCFCGSGTTPVVAEKLGRRWIAADLGRFAIHTTRKRLLSISEVRPFTVQNLGKYERQLWQAAEFGESATARTAAYRSFMLDLYRASPIKGYVWLHGLKEGRMVHVGTVDAPVTVGDIKQIVAEFRKAVGTGENAPTTKRIDILGWDFAFELNEISRQDAEKAGIDLRLVRIPREVLERRAVEQGDIRFFELAALSVKVKLSGRRVTMSIEDFVIPLDDVPADVQKAITHWEQWIDYWAVDWDNKDDTFHNEWQAYRTRDSRDLALSTEHEYVEPGEYMVVVKVIDILGNDTTKTMAVRVDGRGA